ncbi:hypothetical protein D1007_22574 [Hordeum vulgare]|nr:hypothetical protein D1007_22574 [Hordeum vulgare]
MAEAVSLPEDAVREILVRVEDTAALFRCAVTCKRWSHLVADPAFLRRRWPDDQWTGGFLAGFFASKRLDRTDPTFWTGYPMFATFFVPTPRSVFGPCRRSLASFFPDADAHILDHAVPLTARRGLLLVCLASRRQYNMSFTRLAVCNLLAGVCHMLPVLITDLEFDRSGYAILTNADCSSSRRQQPSQPGYSTFFKVLVTDLMYLGLSRLYTFSSDEDRWSKPTHLTSGTAWGTLDYLHPDAVVSPGNVHWSVGNGLLHCSLDMDMETCHISRTAIVTYSDTCNEPQLGVTATGTPLVLTVSRPGIELNICPRQDDNKSDDGAVAKARRFSPRIVKLKPPAKIKRRPNQIYLRLLGEKGGTMLLKDSQRQIYIADVETGVMEQFELPDGFEGLNRSKVVLLEMDWLALFVSRLGKW